jgi:L-asparaginase
MEITFITTGGSIDKDYPKATGAYAFELGVPAVERILKKLNPNFKYEIISVIQKDSLDISDDDRELILIACKNTSSEKIIITHGTDTILETARKVSETQNKTIVITGATKPERFKESDAEFNLGCAVGAVATLETGVYIVMNGRVYPWDKCRRDEVSGEFIEK